MRYSEVLDKLDRIEAECGCDLPPLSRHTPAARAARLLACEDPPRGEDLEFVAGLADGRQGGS